MFQMNYFDIGEVSSVHSDVSAVSATFWCGESVGCGTTTDESDEDSASKEERFPLTKKRKVDVKGKKRSERLKIISEKQIKDSGNQQIKQMKKDSEGRGGKQRKKSQAKPSGKTGKQQKDLETGYLQCL